MPLQYDNPVNGLSGVLSFLFGMAGVFLSVSFAKNAFRLKKVGRRTEGRVLKSELRKGHKGRVIYVPTIGYTAENGQQISFEPAANSNVEHYKEGDVVPVIYDPDRPHERAIDTFAEFWGAPIAVGVLSLFFAVFGFLMMPHTWQGITQIFSSFFNNLSL